MNNGVWMKKEIELTELQKEGSILDGMIEDAIKKGKRISRDDAILKQSHKLNRLIAKYHKEQSDN